MRERVSLVRRDEEEEEDKDKEPLVHPWLQRAVAWHEVDEEEEAANDKRDRKEEEEVKGRQCT